MPYTKEEHQEVAAKAKRDQFGHFVKKPPEPNPSKVPPTQTVNPDSIGVKVEVETVQKTRKDAPLVSFAIQNPFKYLVRFLNKVRKENTVTVKIPPLIAIPVLIAFVTAIPASFGFGRSVEKKEIAALPTPTPIVIIQPTKPPVPFVVSKLGTIKATYQVQALLSPSPSALASPQAGTPTAMPPTATPVPNRYVLVKGEDITFLTVPPEINLSNYQNRKVLISGLYDKITDTLKISKSSDIEILP